MINIWKWASGKKRWMALGFFSLDSILRVVWFPGGTMPSSLDKILVSISMLLTAVGATHAMYKYQQEGKVNGTGNTKV